MAKVYILGISHEPTHSLVYVGTKAENGETEIQGIEIQSTDDIIKTGKLLGVPVSIDDSLEKGFVSDSTAAFAYTMSVSEQIAA